MPSLVRLPFIMQPRSRLSAAVAASGLFGTAALAAVQIAWSLNAPRSVPVRLAEATLLPAPPAPERALPQWKPVHDPEPLFGLGPGLYPVPVRHEVHRLDDGVTRMDVFTFGDHRSGAFARLALERLTDASPDMGGLFVSVARKAAAEGFAVERAARPVAARSRFGVMETAEVTLAGPSGPVACTVFRGTAENGPLRYSGWSCAAPSTAEAARCLVDVAAFSPEIHEPALARVFEETEADVAPGCRPPAPKAPEYTSSVAPRPSKAKPKG
jgi:hypothetical protein